MSSIFELLDQVRARPEMYLGDAETDVARLRNLELLIAGYTLAVRAHRLQEPVTDLLRAFADHLRRTRGWSAACGPVAAIRDATDDDTVIWNQFWILLAEYRETLRA